MPDASLPARPAVLSVQDGQPPVVTLHGDIDLSAVDGVSAVVDEAFSVAKGSVVLDLSDVSFMDSSGVSVLVRAKDDGAARSIELVLRSLSPAAQRILDLAGTTDWFQIES